MNYYHQGQEVCSSMFFFLHSIGAKRRRNLISHFIENGIAPRIHGNTGRLPNHTLPLKSTEYVVQFLLNYSEENALLLPGRVPGYSRSDLKLLPSSVSKRGIWRIYHSAASLEDNIHAVAYSIFCRAWRNLLPSIISMKPMSDLCWQCQQNSTAIMRSSNLPETEKSVALLNAEEYLDYCKLSDPSIKLPVIVAKKVYIPFSQKTVPSIHLLLHPKFLKIPTQ